MVEFVEIRTTVAQRSDAERIAQALVEARLAACAQILGPITSLYRWRGVIETAEEWLCCVKSRRELYLEIEAAIRRLHPYEVPEILANAILDGSPSYLAWLAAETKGDS